MDQLYYDLERKARIVLHMYNIYTYYIYSRGMTNFSADSTS